MSTTEPQYKPVPGFPYRAGTAQQGEATQAMTVGELLERLRYCDPSLPVYLIDDVGFDVVRHVDEITLEVRGPLSGDRDWVGADRHCPYPYRQRSREEVVLIQARDDCRPEDCKGRPKKP